MKRIFLVMVALVLSASSAFAGTTKQKWTAGPSNFNEPLNYNKSKVEWSVAETKLTVTFNLVGATPSKLYQVALDIFCTTFPATFGQFPTDLGSGNCFQETLQGVTATDTGVELGVVLTDIHGNGSFKVVVGPIASGTYNVEFLARDGTGCHVTGGAGGSNCADDFQSPGPIWGDTTTITIP